MATSPVNLQGKPLERSSQIADKMARIEALRALLYGGDEDSSRSTRATIYKDDPENMNFGSEGGNMPWYEDLAELDRVISEEVAASPTPLPTSNLLEKIDDMTEKLGSWFAAALPVYQKRVMRYAFDEMAELSSLLKAGKINAAAAGDRFNTILAEVNEVVDFSRFED